jgi:glycosyltransferase involved in cell wall biosynthesis
LLFSNGQSQSFVNAFEQMATNQELRQTFADRAHQKYWSNFSRKHQINRYNTLIEEVITNKKG